MKTLEKGMKTMMVILMVAFAFGGYAQDHECKKHQSNYGIRFNNGDYAGAYPFWQAFIKSCPPENKDCPCNDPSHLYNGAYILSQVMWHPDHQARQRALIDSNLWVYEALITHYEKTPDALGRYGMALFTDPNQIQKSHDLLKEAVDLGKENSTYWVVQGFIQKVGEMKQKGMVECDYVVETYFIISDVLESMKTVGQESVDSIAKVQGIADNVAAPCLSCDELVLMVEAKVKALPEDCESKKADIEKYLKLLDSKDCQDSQVFKDLAVMSYGCDKSHSAAYNLAVMYWKDKNYSEAMKYVQEALDLDSEGAETAKYNYTAAQIASNMGSCQQAMAYGKKAAAAGNPKGYKIIGDCIVRNTNCGNTTIKRLSVYWLASDYYEKAGYGADHFKSNYPSTEQLFDEGIKIGSSFTVPCFGESTTVRAK